MKDRLNVIATLRTLGAQVAYNRGDDLIMTLNGAKILIPSHKRIPDGSLAAIMRQVERGGIPRQHFKVALRSGH